MEGCDVYFYMHIHEYLYVYSLKHLQGHSTSKKYLNKHFNREAVNKGSWTERPLKLQVERPTRKNEKQPHTITKRLRRRPEVGQGHHLVVVGLVERLPLERRHITLPQTGIREDVDRVHGWDWLTGTWIVFRTGNSKRLGCPRRSVRTSLASSSCCLAWTRGGI